MAGDRNDAITWYVLLCENILELCSLQILQLNKKVSTMHRSPVLLIATVVTNYIITVQKKLYHQNELSYYLYLTLLSSYIMERRSTDLFLFLSCELTMIP